MSMAERNRSIKRTLEAAFGRGSLHSTAGDPIGRWSYRAPREPAPTTGRAAP